MSNEIVVNKSSNDLWICPNEIQTIKEIYGKNLTNGEFSTFIQLGKATTLNPYLREIWAVKYGDNPAQIFIGRDGYRRSAQANPNYDYHHPEAVYSNDDLHYDLGKGEVTHKQDFKNRGNLIGAYCITKRKNSSKPTFVFVDLKEYNTGKSLWATKPATMIKKVAEAQCLRMAFQELFGGTYTEEEYQYEEKDITPHIPEGLQRQQIEGTPISQSFVMEPVLLKAHLEEIANSPEKSILQENYKAAKKEAGGDKDASNQISIATKARLDYLKNIPVDPVIVEEKAKAREEFLKEYDSAETK